MATEDDGKPRWTALPWVGLAEVVEVISHAERTKHTPGDWAGKDPARFLDKVFRHTTRWMAGERLDPESRRSHLAHAAACLLMLVEIEARRGGLKEGP